MIALIVLAVFIVAVLVWNLVPGIRDRLKGWTTILEAVGALVLQGFDIFAQAVQEANKLGYLPTQLVGLLPFVVLGWIIYKRAVTTTPVGKK